MSDVAPETITLEMMRESLYAAVGCEALDGFGYTNQSPNVPLPPLTGEATLVGRCKTTLGGDMYPADPSPSELELLAVAGGLAEDHAAHHATLVAETAAWGDCGRAVAAHRRPLAYGCKGRARRRRSRPRKSRRNISATSPSARDNLSRGLAASSCCSTLTLI